MAEIIKTYKQSVPAMRFIGVKYGDGDRVNGGFGTKWGEWFQSNRFAELEKLAAPSGVGFYEDAGAYIGLMRAKEDEPFEYWIGMYTPENTPVPMGFGFTDFPAGTFGVCWVYGQEPDVYMKEDKCLERLHGEGWRAALDPEGACWFFERYGAPRFTTPDDKGNIILDICFYLK